jgi:stringent starvation protein B
MSEQPDPGAGSTKPYLLRALYEWCCDNGFTPYLAVKVDDSVRVPREHVRNGEIVLNISFGATSGLNMGNDDIRFKARFGGVARDIIVPVTHVTAIYARENGQGMAFPPPTAPAVEAEPRAEQPAPSPPPVAGGGARLHAVPASASESASEPPETAHAPASPERIHPERSGPADDGDDGDDGGERPEPPPRPSGPHLKRVK